MGRGSIRSCDSIGQILELLRDGCTRLTMRGWLVSGSLRVRSHGLSLVEGSLLVNACRQYGISGRLYQVVCTIELEGC